MPSPFQSPVTGMSPALPRRTGMDLPSGLRSRKTLLVALRTPTSQRWSPFQSPATGMSLRLPITRVMSPPGLLR